ncbi:hypothetical protein FRC06_004067 [Ceratobasidium sp. 370]|nr:hypothetical protein FRC06_004067 [Ceratobasidium sp. 370]
MSWFGGLISMFSFIFPPAAPPHFETHAQFILRQPVPGLGLPPAHAPGPDLVDPDPDPSDDEGPPEADTSIVSHGYRVQARGLGREVIRIPDFVIDQDVQAGRGFILLIEVKASFALKPQDFMRFIRYIDRLRAIAGAGGLVQDITVMLIAGGRVYAWDFAHLPHELRQEDLLQMEYTRLDSIRNGFPQ